MQIRLLVHNTVKKYKRMNRSSRIDSLLIALSCESKIDKYHFIISLLFT